MVSPVSAAPAVLALAVPVLAQTVTFESPEHGIRLQLPKVFEQVPLDPMDRQSAGKWQFEKTTIYCYRLRKPAPTTGDEEGEDDEPEMESFKDQATANFNRARTLEKYLQIRGISRRVSLDEPREKHPRTKSKDGLEYRVREYNQRFRGDWRCRVRAYEIETEAERYGLVAIDGDLNDRRLAATLYRMARSLERIQIVAEASDTGEEEARPARGKEYREQVRAALPEDWEAHDTDNFILVTNCRNRRLIRNMLTDLEVMRKEYEKHFPPIEPIEEVSTVRVFDSHDDYRAYGAPRGTGGYFAWTKGELVLFDPGRRFDDAKEWLKDLDMYTVLYHEAMHQYLHYANGRLAPASWFNEGYGEYFGGADIDRRRGEVRDIDYNGFRMKFIREAQRRGGWPDLEAFVRMTQREFYSQNVMSNYAFAWAFCYYLEGLQEDEDAPEPWRAIPGEYLKNLREVTEEYKEKLPDDAPKDWVTSWAEPIQRETFDRTFEDIDFLALEKAWIEEMKTWR